MFLILFSYHKSLFQEKLRDKTNVYFQPLPFNCTKEDLQECIADKLKLNQMDIDWSSNEVTCHVQAGKDGKNPVGFCRLPTQDHAQTVIDLMNNRQWADVGIKYALSEPCLVRKILFLQKEIVLILATCGQVGQCEG